MAKALNPEELAEAFRADPAAFVGFIVAMAPVLSDDDFAGEVVDAITEYDSNIDSASQAETANEALNVATDVLVAIYNGEV